jgi:hypothetical protein
MNIEVSASQKAAIERLIRIALGDTGQSRRVANFLLAWWNAEECGGFDFTDLWNVDAAIGTDMVITFGLLASLHCYPDKLGYGEQFGEIVAAWRSHVIKG